MRRTDDMRKPEPTRSWLPMYMAFAVTVGLLWLERHASLTPADHMIALLTIVAIFFVVTSMWLRGQDRRWH